MKHRPFAPIGMSVALAVAIAVYFVHSYNHEPAGYAAVYTVVAMWLVCVVTVLLGLILLIFRKTRRAGTIALVGALALPCLFALGVRLSESAGWVLWAGQGLVPIRADVIPNEVVYMKAGVTEQEINELHDASLFEPRLDGRGLDLITGIRLSLGLPRKRPMVTTRSW